MIKLHVHSIVNIITNSSTVIYTWQDSVKEAKELLQEILKLSGTEKNVDDLFYFGVFLADCGRYCEYLDDHRELAPDDYPLEGWKEKREYIENYIVQIMKGEVTQPEWMEELKNGDGYDFPPDTSLSIIPKDEIYDGLVEKMIKFLNSPSCDGGRDG